ncbi:peptidase [Serratia liquefaciens]|uniref:peptidase n=1 Tax=Serratia liquefaciens TaxID=614 RepID=UPI002182953A|nr:peptidase [Serratia liquefaciens]CAI2420309.1 Uncharacterised protein [Serratia liquefaciens]
MTTQTSTATLAVFAPGTHTAMDGRTMTITTEDCLDMANSYDPALSEAPFVIGHPKLTAPSYGWSRRFEYRDGFLYTEPHQVNPAFAESFNAGSYKKRSLSFYLPNSPGNPKPGHFYPRHVGFLGAVPPGVKGLPDAEFAEFAEGDDAPVSFAIPWETEVLTDLLRGVRDYIVEKDGAERADQLMPQWRLRTLEEIAANAVDDSRISPLAYAEETNVDPNKKTPVTAEVLTQRETALAEREAKLLASENAAKERELKARREAIVSYADGLVAAGSILPRQKAGVVEVLLSLDSAPLSFADGETTVSKTPEALLRDVLNEKPAVVDFSEKSREGDDAALDFADVSAVADAANVYVAEQAKLGRTVSITDAVNYVKKGAK